MSTITDFEQEDGVLWRADDYDSGGEDGVLWRADDYGDGEDGVLWRADDCDDNEEGPISSLQGARDGEVLWRADESTDNLGSSGGIRGGSRGGGEVLWRADGFDEGSDLADDDHPNGTEPATIVQRDWSGTSLRSAVLLQSL